ncbi:MAG: VWA domain-containing protein, partial [Planctomycetes bacterium]|nr:VWA domain-containing protein [Planctomycetota bacterium]
MVTLGTTVVVNGAFTHSFSSPDGETLHSLITGDSMSAFIAAGNGASWSGTAQDFRVEREYDTESGSYLWDLDLTVSGSRIPGRIIFDTTLPFTGGEGDPSSGVLVITGAEGATATIVAIDDIQVQILVDLDGGGGTDITQALAYCGELVREPKRTIVVLITDLLDKQGYQDALRFLMAQQMDAYVVQVLSHEEIDPDVKGDLKLV